VSIDVDGAGMQPAMTVLRRWSDEFGVGDDAGARLRYALESGEPLRGYALCMQHTATHCSTLQHTATHCNTLQHIATHMMPVRVCDMRSSPPSLCVGMHPYMHESCM